MRFLDLPRELRDEVYALLFAEVHITTKGEPGTPHATAILLASKQLRQEAILVVRKVGLFVVHIDPKYIRSKEKEVLRTADQHVPPHLHFIGPLKQLQNFNRYLICLGKQPLTNWKLCYATFLSTINAILLGSASNITTEITLGDVRPRRSYEYSVSQGLDLRLDVNGIFISDSDSQVEREVEDRGARMRAAFSDSALEDVAFLHLIQLVGRFARGKGLDMWLQNENATMAKKVVGNHVADVIDVAATVNRGKGLALVVGL